MKCPFCKGQGFFVEYVFDGGDCITSPCSICRETGRLSLWEWSWQIFWNNAPVWFIEWYGSFRYRKERTNKSK